MPKVSVYVSNDIYAKAKALGLNLSQISKAAIAEAVGDEQLTVSELLERQQAMLSRVQAAYAYRAQVAYTELRRRGLEPEEIFPDLPLEDVRPPDVPSPR